MRKVLLFIFTLILLSFQFSSDAHADIFQDVYNSLLGGGHNPQFPNASLDGGGYLPATADFCPVCPLSQPNSVYQKYGYGEQPGNLGCHTPDGNRINSGGTALNCASTAYKYCGNQGQDTGGKTSGCCKDTALKNCTRNPSNPDEPPPVDTEKCIRCPEGTFQETRDSSIGPQCYYPKSNHEHPATYFENFSDDDSACVSPLICDRSYYTGCKTQAQLNDLQNNPPGGKSVKPNTPLSLPCKDDPDSYNADDGCLKIKTAVGNINTSPDAFVKWVLGIILSLAGGLLVILLIMNGYKLMVSGGDPEKIKEGRDGIIAAIAGLLLIIFSLVLLQFITHDILGIPGFGP